jgi:hypothetical protein
MMSRPDKSEIQPASSYVRTRPVKLPSVRMEHTKLGCSEKLDIWKRVAGLFRIIAHFGWTSTGKGSPPTRGYGSSFI